MEEKRYIKTMEGDMAYTYKYPRPALTADCVVITKEPTPKVLLIQRGNEPFKGLWVFASQGSPQQMR